MGCCRGCLCSVCSDDSTCFLRQEDAAKNVSHIRSYGGTDGCRGCRRMAGLSDECLVSISPLVPAGIVFIDLLVPVSFASHVETDAMASKCCDLGGRHRTGRQCDAVSAPKCLSVCVFGADGMHDGFAHADHDELSAQHAASRGSA